MKRCRNTMLVGVLVLAFVMVGATQVAAREVPSLCAAALAGNAEQVQQMIASGADVQSPDADGRTPLACAVRGGSVEAVNAILEAGASANGASREGLPLFLAAREGRVDMVELLLQKGAEPGATDSSGSTGLHGAAISGSLEVAVLLLGRGVDPAARNAAGLTAEALAQATQRTEIVGLLQASAQNIPARGPAAAPGRGRPGGGPGQRAFPGGERGRPMRGGRPGLDMPGGPAMPTTPAVAPTPVATVPLTAAQVLEDPNAIRARVASFSGLGDALAGLDSNSLSEQRLWRRQTSDNRTTVLRSATTQFASEMDMLRTVAQKENATATVQAIEDLTAKREQRNEAVSDMLREQRRAEIQAERDAERTNRTRGTTTRGRGRAGTVAEPAMPTYTPAAMDAADGPQYDAETEQLIRAWESASMDKRSLLDSVLDMDLNDLNGLRESASAENADETTAAIEGLMLARQMRRDAILDEIAADEERQARRDERAASQNSTTTPAGAGRRMR